MRLKETNKLAGEIIKGYWFATCVTAPSYFYSAELIDILINCDIYVTALFFCIIFGEQCLTKRLKINKYLRNLEVATAVNALRLLSLLINYHSVVFKEKRI